MSRLDTKPQIGKLANDLGLKKSGKPVSEIVRYVRRKIRSIAKNYNCRSLTALLNAAAGNAGTIFREIHSDSDLDKIIEEFVSKGEAIFANLRNELREQDYAITIKRQHAQSWEPPFVSVIDCRGDKVFRAYFSKWHELAHLFTLTPQMRLMFRRTHGAALQDPEEALMDVIAGELGFLSDLLKLDGREEISFETIDRIRSEFCPEASVQASIIGIVKALPQACILLDAKLGHKRGQRTNPRQTPSRDPQGVVPVLRAVHVTVNQAARDAGIRMYPNWRVPDKSVIHQVFDRQEYGEAVENLNWWTTSDGSRLADCSVVVKAKASLQSVIALVIPED
ncbi:MAG: hypothetical protein LAN84_01060 [Acidobacteriia bacterium]|nr:hypothetical protein [Terriglobia bacterium]